VHRIASQVGATPEERRRYENASTKLFGVARFEKRPNPVWTPERNQYLREHPDQYPRDSAAALGLTENAIRHQKIRLGLSPKRKRPAPQKTCADCGTPLKPSAKFRCKSCWRVWQRKRGLLENPIPLIKRLRKEVEERFEGDYRRAALAWGFRPKSFWKLVRGWGRKDKRDRRVPIRHPSMRTLDQFSRAWNIPLQELLKLVPQTREEHWKNKVQRKGNNRTSVEKKRVTRNKHREEMSPATRDEKREKVSQHIRKGVKPHWDRIRQDPKLLAQAVARAQRAFRLARDRRVGRRSTKRGRTAFLCPIVRAIIRWRQHYLKNPTLAAEPNAVNRKVAKDCERKYQTLKDSEVAARYSLGVKDIHSLPIEHARKCLNCRPPVAYDLFSTGMPVQDIARLLRVSVPTAERAIARGRATAPPEAYRVMTGQIARYAGVTINTARGWADRGVLGPATWRGRRRTFSLRILSKLPAQAVMGSGVENPRPTRVSTGRVR
jgi:transposase-like protein